MCEHTHIPVSRRTPFFGGGDLPKRYAHTHDPFVALSFAAAATHKLVLGTGVCLVVEHDPIVTAKSVASRDRDGGGGANKPGPESRTWLVGRLGKLSSASSQRGVTPDSAALAMTAGSTSA